MKRDENPFDGRGVYVKMANIIYDLLMKRNKVTNAEVMAKYIHQYVSSDKEYDDILKIVRDNGVSNFSEYGELKKAFSEIRIFLRREFCDKVYRDEEGNRSSCAIVRGNCSQCINNDYVDDNKGGTRNKSFIYVGEDNDPLGKYKTSKAITDLSQYARFCADSAGFFPTAWLDYFLGGSMDLFKIKQRKEKEGLSIVSSADRPLDNINLLPELYVAIRDKKVLKMSYKRIEGEMEFHPHILKEFNGRWFLFGYDNTYKQITNIALDRIIEFSEIPKAKYIPAEAGYYESYFRDKIGVSTDKNKQPAEDIIFRARNYNMFNLVKTKPFHHSQKVLKEYGEYDGKKYGEFGIHVEVNNEFIGRILQMGAGLEVISPSRVRDIFKDRTKYLSDLYNND